MTILEVVAAAATKIGIDVPSAVYAATTRQMIEMKTAIKDAALEISNAHDWQELKLIATLTGTGAADDFALPTDYDRMLLTASMWSSVHKWGMQHVLDSDSWLELLTIPYTIVGGAWHIYGSRIYIADTMASGDTAKFFYLSNKIADDTGGTPKVAFTADSDVYRLDEWLLTLCVVWKWKAAKSLPYAEEMASYNQYLATMLRKDEGSKPVISTQRRNRRSNVWPGTVSAAP